MSKATNELDRREEIIEKLVDTDYLEVLSDIQSMEDYLESERADEYGARVESLAYHRILQVMLAHLDNLSEYYQEVLHLKFWEDCSDEEVAERLGLSPGQVSTRLRRALCSLRKEILSTMQHEFSLGKKEVLCAIYG